MVYFDHIRYKISCCGSFLGWFQHTVAVLQSRNDDRTRRRGRKPKLDSLQLDKMRS